MIHLVSPCLLCSCTGCSTGNTDAFRSIAYLLYGEWAAASISLYSLPMQRHVAVAGDIFMTVQDRAKRLTDTG